MILEKTHGVKNRKLRALILNHKHETERQFKIEEAFKLSKPTSSNILPPAIPCLLNLPKQHINWGPNNQMLEVLGNISFKPPQGRKTY